MRRAAGRDGAPGTAPPAPGARARAAAALAAVLAAAAWVHAPALRAPFLGDDYLFLDQVRGRGPIEALASPDPIGNFLRPVGRALWFWVWAHAGGESPLTFHAASLALFLLALALLWTVARPHAGVRGATLAAGLLALHPAADVAVLWAAGAQDLLALTAALGALLLHRAGRRAWAAAALAVALLSKETAIVTPAVAVLVSRRPGETWAAVVRRTWPLALTAAAWAVVWLATAHARPAAGAVLSFEPLHLPAALAHLAHLVPGIEWAPGRAAAILASPPPWVPMALVLAALALAAPTPRKAPDPAPGAVAGGRHGRAPRGSRAPSAAEAATPPATHARASAAGGIVAGLGWAALGALPVAAVAPIWSGYHYLFALCGAALAAGAALARAPLAAALAVVALVAWTGQSARRLDEFATRPDPWSTVSHVNRHYVERAGGLSMGLLADLRALRPTLPRGATLFFRGLPAWSAFQVGDGALVRWAYRDTSLRSHLQTEATAARLRRGPALFFAATGERLAEAAATDNDLVLMGVTMLVDGRPEAARDLLRLADERMRGDPVARYPLTWVEWSLDPRPQALEPLRGLGVTLDARTPPELPAALARIEAGDTAGAVPWAEAAVRRAALHPGAHALLADLSLRDPASEVAGGLEAWIALQLAPRDPIAWRRWALVLMVSGRHTLSVQAFERYLALAGPAGAADTEAHTYLEAMRRRTVAGDLVREGLRRPR